MIPPISAPNPRRYTDKCTDPRCYLIYTTNPRRYPQISAQSQDLVLNITQPYNVETNDQEVCNLLIKLIGLFFKMLHDVCFSDTKFWTPKTHYFQKIQNNDFSVCHIWRHNIFFISLAGFEWKRMETSCWHWIWRRNSWCNDPWFEFQIRPDYASRFVSTKGLPMGFHQRGERLRPAYQGDAPRWN